VFAIGGNCLFIAQAIADDIVFIIITGSELEQFTFNMIIG
jgi:hypothetical protein